MKTIITSWDDEFKESLQGLWTCWHFICFPVNAVRGREIRNRWKKDIRRKDPCLYRLQFSICPVFQFQEIWMESPERDFWERVDPVERQVKHLKIGVKREKFDVRNQFGKYISQSITYLGKELSY